MTTPSATRKSSAEDRIVDDLMADPVQARRVQARLEERLTKAASPVRIRPAPDANVDDLWDNVPV